ncbi:MAG: hypothetical protein JWM39_214 [Parcubacteria group bacterium]|nr:hypothetical protein [Parcubacteria group bacterium]
MPRRNSSPQYGPEKTKKARKNEVWVGAKLFYLDDRTGKVMVAESDMDPYLAPLEDIPQRLRALLP